ncbi:DUF2031 domain-containing protein [Nostoc edaphicum CCNP1411]|uniref:DUF2031 domain-containing protein n=1 Tax=Nostoc edaphicum CCNP1411 TaxID=1472755 RepID=A0A7D7LF52_9NOSO|nr:DUF2031 domain-containing protein [Nostoc edaphicum]QMS87327.1 DUF2031 domain-containing protein [Nostoc edaphicum CCNP1411]
MEVKLIAYKRVLNLGNYENKHLELSAEVHEGDDFEAEISHLMEVVERKIREPKETDIVNRINSLETRSNNLRQEISYLQEKLGELKSKNDNLTEEEPIPDDIPFDIDTTKDF